MPCELVEILCSCFVPKATSRFASAEAPDLHLSDVRGVLEAQGVDGAGVLSASFYLEVHGPQ